MIAGFCFLCLTLGYRTRLFTVFSWIFFVSFSARAPAISHGGDDLIRMALFWMIFVPANHFFSVDKVLSLFKNFNSEPSSKSKANVTELSFATCALSGQLIAVYFFTVLLKWHPVWTTEASAIYYSLQIDQYITPIAQLLQKLPYEWMRILTHLTLVIEFCVPFLVFIPFKNSFFRWVSILTLVGFHLGLFFTFYLGTFPWICMAYWMIFIPTSFWEKQLARLQTNKKATIYYDGGCNYCLKMIYLLKTFLILPGVTSNRAQDFPAANDLMVTNNSWIIQKSEGTFHTHFNGFIELLRLSPFHFITPLFNNRPISLLGHSIYIRQAANRKSMANILNYLKPSPLTSTLGFIPQTFVLFFFAIAMYWCVALHSDEDRWKIASPIDEIGSFLRLHQKWDMFAPYPWKDDGWIVVDAKLLSGESWDILSNQKVDFSKPQDFTVVFKNTAVRKYLINLYNVDYSNYRLFYGQHLCAKWNTRNPGQRKVDTFKIYYVLEQTPEPGKNPAIPENRLLWDHHCFEKPLG